MAAQGQESQGGYKSCPKGEHVIFWSNAGGWVHHKFSTDLIGSGNATVFTQKFGAPVLYQIRVTYTWKRSAWWQVKAFDSEHVDGDIKDVTVGCIKRHQQQPSGVGADDSGFRKCPAGQYLWVATKYYGKFVQKWRRTTDNRWQGLRGGTWGDIGYSVMPTWKRQAHWRVYVWGSGSDHYSTWTICSKHSGGKYD